MKKSSLTLSDKKPPSPLDADYALYIDFKKGQGRPERVFQAAEAMITSFHKLDKVLCECIDSNISPLLVLEDIEAGSLKIWLKTQLEATDDTSIKDLEWRKIVGSYLVKAKYAYLNWPNKTEEKTALDFSQHIKNIASETDVKHLPDYRQPRIQDLMAVAADIEKAKSFLVEEDKMSFSSSNDTQKVEFNLSIHWTPEELSEFATKEILHYAAAPMILAVKKPDYLGSSSWDFRHGKKAVTAKIEDMDWVRRFQNREIDVRPGDALRCLVAIDHSYGYDNELVEEKYTIKKVLDVLTNGYQQPTLFEP